MGTKREYPASALLAAVVLASLGPFLLLGSLLLYQYVSNEREAALRQVRTTAEAISATLDREFQGRFETLRALAATGYLSEGKLAQFANLLRAASSTTPGDFVLENETGQQLINTRLEGRALPTTSPDIADHRSVFEQPKPRIGDLFTDASDGTPRFTLRIPVIVDRSVTYAFGYTPHTEKVLTVLRESSLPHEWFAAVIDRNGHLVARSSRHDEFVGKPASREFLAKLSGVRGQIESVDLEGRETVTSYRRSAMSEWTTVVWVPKRVLQAPSNLAFASISALAFATLMLSLGAGYVVSRLIRKPTQDLLESANALQRGSTVKFEHTAMREANVIGDALADASRDTQLYMREISHRSKNLLAVVDSIARQTQRTAPDFKTFAQRFQSRLQSLARSHDLLVDRNWGGVPLRELISAQLASFIESGDSRIELFGPPLILNPAASQHLGLAIHELATNASKYGALSVQDGSIRISWKKHSDADGSERFKVVWQESNGPAVSPSSRKGFGRFVIESAVATGLAGKAHIDWHPNGLTWTLDAPSSSLVGDTTFLLDKDDGVAPAPEPSRNS